MLVWLGTLGEQGEINWGGSVSPAAAANSFGISVAITVFGSLSLAYFIFVVGNMMYHAVHPDATHARSTNDHPGPSTFMEGFGPFGMLSLVFSIVFLTLAALSLPLGRPDPVVPSAGGAYSLLVIGLVLAVFVVLYRIVKTMRVSDVVRDTQTYFSQPPPLSCQQAIEVFFAV